LKTYQIWLMILTGALYYCYQFILRVSPNMMTDELVISFSADATFIGFFSSCYYLTYSMSLIPVGILMDRYGPRKIFPLGGILCFLGCFIFSISTDTLVACSGRFLIGLGASCGFVGTLKLGSLWLKPQDMGKVVALTMVGGTVGGVLGSSPLEYFLNTFGWRVTHQFLGLVGLAIALLHYTIMRVPKNFVNKKPNNIVSSFKEILSSSKIWIVAIYGMLMYAPLILVTDMLGISFIERLYQIKETEAAKIIIAMYTGILFGSPIFSISADFFNKRKSLMLGGSILYLLCYLSILYVANIPFSLMYVLFFGAGFFFGAKSLTFSTISLMVEKRNTGLAVGIANSLVMTAGVIFLPIAGYLLDFNNSSHYSKSMSLYTTDDFRLAMGIIPICIFSAVILITFITDKDMRRKKNNGN
jgi:MFS family permease